MTKAADKNCELLIFDYSQSSSDIVENPFLNWSDGKSAPFFPIYLDEFRNTLSETGWTLKSSTDISVYFKKWYEALLMKFESKKQAMQTQFDSDLVNKMHDAYARLLKLIMDKKVGGVVVFAKRDNDL